MLPRMDLRQTEKYLERRNIKTGLTSVLIAQRALERGVEVFGDADRRLSMKVGRNAVWFDGARSNINNLLARRCTRYKDVTSRLLSNYGIPVPSNISFPREDAEAAWAWAQTQLPVVVKPPNDGMGSSVHVGITDQDTFARAFAEVGASSDSVLVERFVEGVEHRVLLVYGKVVAAARRVPAHVIGDGTSTVQQLVDEKNALRTASKNPVHYQIPVDETVVRHMAGQDMTLDSIPHSDQRVWLRANSNVHSGGDGVDATDELRPAEIKIAERVAKAIPGLRLAGLDLLLPRDGKGADPCVLEVNGTPMITGHHFPWYGESRDAAGMLVAAMYPDRSVTGVTAKMPLAPELPVVKRKLRRALGR